MSTFRFTPAELFEDPDLFAGYDDAELCPRCHVLNIRHRWFDFDADTAELVGCSLTSDFGTCSFEPSDEDVPPADIEPGTRFLAKHGPDAELRSALMMGA